MYSSVQPQAYFDVVSSTTQVVSGFWSSFRGIKALLGNAFTNMLVGLCLIPFILLFKCLKKTVKKNYAKRIEINELNYIELRNSFDKTSRKVDALKWLLKINSNKTQFPLNILLRNVQDLISAMDEGNIKIAQSLTELDHLPAGQNNKWLTQVSEEELWESRPKVYQYRL